MRVRSGPTEWRPAPPPDGRNDREAMEDRREERRRSPGTRNPAALTPATARRVRLATSIVTFSSTRIFLAEAGLDRNFFLGFSETIADLPALTLALGLTHFRGFLITGEQDAPGRSQSATITTALSAGVPRRLQRRGQAAGIARPGLKVSPKRPLIVVLASQESRYTTRIEDR